MAFILNKAATGFRPHFHCQQKMEFQSHRQFHIQEPGARERALLKEGPVLKQFKTAKRSVKGYIRLGYALTFVVIAGCCRQIYVKAVMRKEARKQAQTTK